MTVSYLHVLNRLAHTTFLNEKYSEALKYFEVALQLSNQIQPSDMQKFYAQWNLILFYISTDLKKAKQLTLDLYQNKDLNPTAKKELKILLGTICTLGGDYPSARSHYRDSLREASSTEYKGISLNNLAMTNFYEY